MKHKNLYYLIIGLAVKEVTLQIALGSFSRCRLEMDLMRESRIRVPSE